MSREKMAKLMALSETEMAVYRSKRNQRVCWQRLSHEDWVEFCKEMAGWFDREAPNEWDDYVKANNARKAKSDAEALKRKKDV